MQRVIGGLSNCAVLEMLGELWKCNLSKELTALS